MKSLSKIYDGSVTPLESKVNIMSSNGALERGTELSRKPGGVQSAVGVLTGSAHCSCGHKQASFPCGLSSLIWEERRQTPSQLWSSLCWTLWLKVQLCSIWGGGQKPLGGHRLLGKSSWFPLSGSKNKRLQPCSIAGKSAN